MTSAASAGSPVDGILATATIVLSLVLAAWALVAAARNRPPDRIQLLGLAVLEVGLLVLAALALVALGGGDRPGEPGAFFGYLVTLVCLPPLAAVLARMEPTRWGSAIVCAICLVTPVVVVRLQQTWEVLGG
jgi:4-amino-4-deoxy-L-arabinose transferase-like glycosyltransferase